MARVDARDEPASSDGPGRHWVTAFDGGRLTACRRARAWNQVQLAEALHRRQTDNPDDPAETARRIRSLVVQVSCYEANRTRPRARAVRDLATVLGVDVLDLLRVDTPLTLPALRARLGMTQATAATALGMSRSLYAHIEQKRRRLRPDEESVLARVLQVDAATIRRATEPEGANSHR
jgi:transcriptional regulator with XRE-family HTH domain